MLEVRESEEGLELALYLPDHALEDASRPSLDVLCQVVEGVSHFVYLSTRAACGRPVDLDRPWPERRPLPGEKVGQWATELLTWERAHR